MFLVKDLSNIIYDFNNLSDAESRFDEFPNSTEIILNDINGNNKIVKNRAHKEIGVIEINNKCVYLKVPFFQPSDKPEIRISKIGETPEKLRSKMDVIDEKWES